MGMFSQNRTMLSSDFEVVANESYKGSAGAYRAMTEGYQNSYAVFESCIGLDFMEAAVVNESADTEDFTVIQEGFASDFFGKIKEFLVKLIEKIKGIVKSFIVKITGTFCKNGKALVNKYKSDVLKKDCSKMKYKWAKAKNVNPEFKTTNLKGVYDSVLIGLATSAPQNDGYWEDIAKAKTSEHNTDTYRKLELSGDKKKIKEDLSEKVQQEEDLGSMCGKTNTRIEMSDFAKEFHEYMFDDEEECEGWGSDGAEISILMAVLSNGGQQLKDLEKTRKKSEDEIKKWIKDVENAQKKVQPLITKKVDSNTHGENFNSNATVINEKLNIAMTAASQMSTNCTKFYACYLDEIKKALAQCKRVFVQAAAYRPKSTNESALFAEAAGEAAEYETFELFDNFVSA